MAKMQSMAYTKTEQKEKKNGPIAVGSSADGPKYPYGLRLCLDSDTLEKLGLDSLPPVGKRQMLTALVEVCSTSQREEADGDKHKSLDLQIVKMGLGPVSEKSLDRNDPDYISKLQEEESAEGED